MSKVDITFLSQEDVVAAGGLEMRDVMEMLEEICLLYGFRDYALPGKPTLQLGGPVSEGAGSRIDSMAGYLGGKMGIAGIEWASQVPQNPSKFGLPSHVGLVVLGDPVTGLPVVVMDGTLVRSIRTGGCTGVAAKYLAPAGAKVVGLIGAGFEGRCQLMALQEALPSVERVVLYDPDRVRSEALSDAVKGLVRWPVAAVGSAEAAVRPADVLVTTWREGDAAISAEWLKSGCFHAWVGGHTRESGSFASYDKVVVEDWEEFKDALPDEPIHATLGEVVTGQKPGREHQGERVLFYHAGLSLADLGLARRILRNAQAVGIGTKLRLWEQGLTT